jgi:predicted Zn-dependent protease
MTGRDPSQPVPDEPDAGPPKAGKRPAARARRAKPAWFGILSQLDFDIEFFDRLLARRPDSLDVLRVLAELVSRKGQVQRAVDLDRRLVELQPDDFLARYNLACSLARAGRPDEAIDSLSRAILLGYDDLAHMEADPDLESLHGNPDFQSLLGGD